MCSLSKTIEFAFGFDSLNSTFIHLFPILHFHIPYWCFQGMFSRVWKCLFNVCLKNWLLKSFSVFSNGLNGSGKSRMNQVKFVEDSFLNIWSNMVCLNRPYHFKFVKSCFPQILLNHSWIPWFKCLLTLHTKIMYMMVLSLTHCYQLTYQSRFWIFEISKFDST